MTTENLKKLPDDQLREIIAFAQTELQERAERRRQDAIDEIMRKAKEVGLTVNIGARKKATKPALRAGDKYQHPDDPAKVWVAGHGRPPKWFKAARKIA